MRLTALALAFLVLGPVAAFAAAAGEGDWNEKQAALCAEAIHAAEVKHDLPPGLLGAIAKVESGRPIRAMGDVRAWPWTINADGDGYFLESNAAAIAWVRLAQSRPAETRPRFVDVGCMQVDLAWHPRAFASLDEAFDPVANADYAARLLRELRDQAGGNWYVATGWYHSQTPELAADYRDRVADMGAGIVRGSGGPEPLYRRALRRGTLRLALAGGGTLVLHVRQPSRTGRHVSPCRMATLLNPLLAHPARGGSCAG